MEKAIFISPKDSLKTQFLYSLEEDLERIGHSVEITQTDEHYIFNIEPFDYSLLSEGDRRKKLQKAYNEIRKVRLNYGREKLFIERMESENILNYLANGEEVDIDKIIPEIKICRNQKDRNIYRYYSYFQTLPTSYGVGRGFSVLVYDIGQKSRKLIGLFRLSSPVYSSYARDTFLGWNRIDERSREKFVRYSGLKRSMQLSVVTALPPYKFIFGGKFMSLLALSDPVSQEFNRRYKDNLLALFTTSAYGPHAAIYNRIQLRKIKDTRYNSYNANLFRHVGEASMYSNVMLTQRTFELAKSMFTIDDEIGEDQKIRAPLSKRRAIAKALSLSGLSQKVLYLNEMGIYVGYLDDKNIDVLRSGPNTSKKPNLDLDPNLCFDYWKSEWVEAKAKDTAREERFTRYDKGPQRLSNLFVGEANE